MPVIRKPACYVGVELHKCKKQKLSLSCSLSGITTQIALYAYSIKSFVREQECIMPLTTSHCVMLTLNQWMFCTKQAGDCVQGAFSSETNIKPCLWCVGVQPFSVTRRLLCYSNVTQERSGTENMEERNWRRLKRDRTFQRHPGINISH